MKETNISPFFWHNSDEVRFWTIIDPYWKNRPESCSEELVVSNRIEVSRARGGENIQRRSTGKQIKLKRDVPRQRTQSVWLACLLAGRDSYRQYSALSNFTKRVRSMHRPAGERVPTSEPQRVFPQLNSISVMVALLFLYVCATILFHERVYHFAVVLHPYCRSLGSSRQYTALGWIRSMGEEVQSQVQISLLCVALSLPHHLLRSLLQSLLRLQLGCIVLQRRLASWVALASISGFNFYKTRDFYFLCVWILQVFGFLDFARKFQFWRIYIIITFYCLLSLFSII